VVSLSNLHRQILYGPEDINKSKVNVATKKLKRLNPQLTILPYDFKLERSNALSLIEKYDLVIDGSDSFSTRYLVNDACIILNKPFVFGAVYKFLGQLSVFNYQGGPSYRCAFPEPAEQNDVPNCSTIGVLGSLTGIIGSMQANEALKIILGHQEVLSGKLMQLNTLSYEFDLIDIDKDPTIPLITELGTYSDESCEITEVKTITSVELNKILSSKKEILIYNLSYSDTQKNQIKGSLNANTEDLLLGSILMPEDKMIVLVCEYGIQSETVAEYLQKTYNKENIYSLKDGMLGWEF
jgi:molybdopterin/thiamine biosynthesis adenylyltransferase/rhodanese-related sulfurtransferase